MTVRDLLYDSALLSSGFQMRDTADFSKRIQRVISNGLNIDPNAEAEAEPEEEVAAEPETTDAADATEPAASEDSTHDEL